MDVWKVRQEVNPPGRVAIAHRTDSVQAIITLHCKVYRFSGKSNPLRYHRPVACVRSRVRLGQRFLEDGKIALCRIGENNPTEIYFGQVEASAFMFDRCWSLRTVRH